MRGLIEATACVCLAIARQLFAVLRQVMLGAQERIMAGVSRPLDPMRQPSPGRVGKPQRATALKLHCSAKLPAIGRGPSGGVRCVVCSATLR